MPAFSACKTFWSVIQATRASAGLHQSAERARDTRGSVVSHPASCEPGLSLLICLPLDLPSFVSSRSLQVHLCCPRCGQACLRSSVRDGPRETAVVETKICGAQQSGQREGAEEDSFVFLMFFFFQLRARPRRLVIDQQPGLSGKASKKSCLRDDDRERDRERGRERAAFLVVRRQRGKD